MLLTPKQLEEVFSIIELNHIIYGGQTIGTDILSPADKLMLKKFNIDINDLKQNFPQLVQSYHWGRLSAALKNQASKVEYNDFLKYLKKGQYIPLNKREQASLKYIKQNTYSHINGLGDKIKQTTNGIIIEEDRKLRDKYQETIGEELQRGVEQRKSVQEISSDIAHKTGDWGRDMNRIIDTEMNNAFQEGRADQLQREKGDEVLCYKDVYPGSCRHCIRLYLTSGVGSQPVIFTLKELKENGTNYGKKVNDWKPTLYGVHPFCRCNLHEKPKGYVWDEEKEAFVPPKVDPETREKKGVKITVGDQTYEV